MNAREIVIFSDDASPDPMKGNWMAVHGDVCTTGDSLGQALARLFLEIMPVIPLPKIRVLTGMGAYEYVKLNRAVLDNMRRV